MRTNRLEFFSGSYTSDEMTSSIAIEKETINKNGERMIRKKRLMILDSIFFNAFYVFIDYLICKVNLYIFLFYWKETHYLISVLLYSL